MQNYKRFKGKIIIITGAASGIGKMVSYRIGLEGGILNLLDCDEHGLQQTVDEFKKKGMQVTSYVLDISEEEEVNRAIFEIKEKNKRIDVLVHAAGIVGPTNTKITDYKLSDFENIYKINLKGTFLITKYVLKAMEENNQGRILLISSIAGKEGNPGMVGYSSTKSGVIGLIKGVAKEYATKNITINGLAPAVIKTAMNENTSAEQLSYMTSKIPMNRLGRPEEVASMVCFIVSDENSFSTGFIYDISGGRATY